MRLVTTSSELGFSVVMKSSSSSGRSDVNRCSYRRTSASGACWAETQWMVPRTLRPSGACPPRVSGSYVHRSSTTSPAASFMTPVHVMK